MTLQATATAQPVPTPPHGTRLRRYAEVIALSGEGYDIRAIARLTGDRRARVRAWLANWEDLCRGGGG